ncbi:hypothetical protein RB796 [Rhodopirellula baltica SH 1]|uniref:Uncharacterized protein n=2 Tax=Rhodopirellula baltica TaxID=265606 RepID=Q7UY90_RHOBA|nr:hypothetical protein RB796 [Rhodopirellula baltica SH 1]
MLVYRSEKEPLKVMMLLASDSSDTITVDQIVPNENYSKSGKLTTFMMGQRYMPCERLLVAKVTHELDQAE